MDTGALGKLYEAGELIIREGDVGDCMYVIQDGQVEVFTEKRGKEVQLAIHGPGSFFGEMALFDRDVRSASVRTVGEARILTIDKRNFMRRVHEDPSLAFRIVETMSQRIRELVAEVTRLKSECLGE
jgi:CRP-like cAMP-binding protein